MPIHRKFWADSTLLRRSQAHGEPPQAQSDPRGRQPHGLQGIHPHVREKLHPNTSSLPVPHPPSGTISQVVPPGPWGRGGGVCVCCDYHPIHRGVQGPGSSPAPSTPLIDITRIPFLQSHCLPNRHTGRRVVRLGKDHLVPLQTESRALWCFVIF